MPASEATKNRQAEELDLIQKEIERTRCKKSKILVVLVDLSGCLSNFVLFRFLAPPPPSIHLSVDPSLSSIVALHSAP